MEGQGQATAPRTTSSKQRSKEREEEYGSSSLQVEEELLDVYIQDSLDDSTRLPSVLRVSLGGAEDGSWEQAAACNAELCEAVSGDENQVASSPPAPQEPCPPSELSPATARLGGFTTYLPMFFFWWLHIYIYIYIDIARMRIEKLKVLRSSVFCRFSIATICSNFKKIDILIHG